MNAFVRDGALNRKKRSRQSTTTTTTTKHDNSNVEAKKKKIRRDDVIIDLTTTAPPRRRDLAAAGTLRPNTGESTVLATVVSNEKESRYANVDFVRASNFLYFDYKKINSIGANKTFKEYLNQFDLKCQKKDLDRIFKQCYDKTEGSVQKSKSMMKKLETGVFVNLFEMTPNVSTKVRNNRLSIMSYKNIEKPVEIVEKKKDSKDMPKRLEQRIQNRMEELFGNDYLQEDLPKIDLYSTVANTDCNYSDSLSLTSESSESYDGFCRLNKSYSVHDRQKDTFGVIICSDKSKMNQMLLAHADSDNKTMIPESKNHTSFHSSTSETFPLKKDKSVIETMIPESKKKRSFNSSEPEIDNNVENTDSISPSIEGALETDNDRQKINTELKEDSIIPDINMRVDVKVLDTDIEKLNEQSEILDYENLELKMRKIINTEDDVFKCSEMDSNVVEYTDSKYPSTEGALETDNDGKKINTELKEESIIPDLSMRVDVQVFDTDIEKSNVQSEILDRESLELKIRKIINTEDDVFKCSEMDSNVVEYTDSKYPSTEGALETDNDGKKINTELKEESIIPDLSMRVDVQVFDTDIEKLNEQSEILDYENLELKIRKIINTEDDVFKCSEISHLASYFLNDEFLSKVDVLWKSSHSGLIKQLIGELLCKFNSIKYNMSTLTGCLICIFREIAEKSSIPPGNMKAKLIVFLDAIKKYIKHHDHDLWRKWFVPSMFLDWCFVVTCMFINTENSIGAALNKKWVIRNASNYFKSVKKNAYFFINPEDIKPQNKILKNNNKKGVFEFSRSEDMSNISDEHATITETQVISNISTNIPFNEPKPKKLKKDDKYINTNNHTTQPGYVEEVCPVPEKVFPLISVCPEFNFSNSFIQKSTWFVGNVSELIIYLKNKWPDTSIDNFNTVQNNITDVANSKKSHNKNLKSKDINKPTKRKRSVKQAKFPRIYHTVANDPKEIDILYSSSAATQNLSSNNNNLSTNHTQLSTSLPTTVFQNCISNYNYTQHPIGLETNPPNVNTTRTSNAKSSTQTSLPTAASQNCMLNYNYTQHPIGLQTNPPNVNNTLTSIAKSSTQTSLPTAASQNCMSNYNYTQHPIGLETNLPNVNTTRTSNAKSSTQTSLPTAASQNCMSNYNYTQHPIGLQTNPPNVNNTLTSNAMSSTQTSLPKEGFSHNLSSYYKNISSNNTQVSISMQTSIIQNCSVNYNNTQLPINLQTNPSIYNTSQTSNANRSHLPASNLPSSVAPVCSDTRASTNNQQSMAANTWPSNVTNTLNIHRNSSNDLSSGEFRNYFPHYQSSALTYVQPEYSNNSSLVNLHPPNISNALTRPTYQTQLSSRDALSTTANVANCTQLNGMYSHDLRNVHPTWNNFQTPDHNTQVSPDLPDVRLPNMPNQQNDLCMAANCTNTSKIPCYCNTIFYCSVLCQGYDWPYHKNQCRFNNKYT